MGDVISYRFFEFSSFIFNDILQWSFGLAIFEAEMFWLLCYKKPLILLSWNMFFEIVWRFPSFLVSHVDTR